MIRARQANDLSINTLSILDDLVTEAAKKGKTNVDYFNKISNRAKKVLANECGFLLTEKEENGIYTLNIDWANPPKNDFWTKEEPFNQINEAE